MSDTKISSKLKPISDIRLYRSQIENIDGNSYPSEFAPKELNIIINRIVMKLRENNFTLGDFDHIYLNFTTCLENGVILPSKRSVDPYHKWYRYYDIGVSEEKYHLLDTADCMDFIVEQIKKTLDAYFSSSGCAVEDCISEALNKGENMMMLYKTKQTPKLKGSIYLQLLDSGEYLPNLFVYEQDGTEIMHEKLPRTLDLMSLGEIQLSSKKVVVKPRNNSLARGLEPIIFEL